VKAIVFILLAAIVVSLGSGLFFLTRDKQDSTRMLKALKVRVALSIVLLAFLLSAFYFGWIS
jgi:hypothetical protein